MTAGAFRVADRLTRRVCRSFHVAGHCVSPPPAEQASCLRDGPCALELRPNRKEAQFNELEGWKKQTQPDEDWDAIVAEGQGKASGQATFQE
jgi:hypothetical protein